jgi:hypothetical protein
MIQSTPASRFHSAGQDGLASKQDLIDEIREHVCKHFPSAELKTLERLSRLDLTVLRHALLP